MSLYDNLIQESYIVNKEDIYYNKEAFNKGETNLCIIIGHSGSGKSTMGNALAADKKTHIDHTDIDDVIDNYRFQGDDFNKKSELFRNFFNSTGKKYRMTFDQIKAYPKYDMLITNDFVNFAKNAAKRNPDKKYVIEGVWIYFYLNPNEFKDYAVFIKGTSFLTSKIRAMKRDFTSKDKKPSHVQMSYVTKALINSYEHFFQTCEHLLKKWVNVYEPLYKAQKEEQSKNKKSKE
jgi:energy-coupling factor transporter ATP-binding protein EcfA2